MWKVSHTTLIVLSGIIWLIVGCALLSLGINILIESTLQDYMASSSKPIVNFFSTFTANQESAVLILLTICLFIGYMKGRYVLGKSALKGVARILTFPNPTHIKNIYSAKYYILLSGMGLLGILVKLFPTDIRGAVDVTIGSALINGAIIYFRSAYELSLRSSTRSPKDIETQG